MPTINFPSGPSLNDTYNLGLRTWKWNGDAWALQPLTGGFTGSQGAIGYTGSIGVGYTGSAGSSTGIDDNATSTAITIDSSQNVGIGTSSPENLLHVFSSAPKIIIQDGGTHGTNSAPRLEFKDSSSIQGFVEFTDDGTMRIDQLKANPLTFLTNNVERMRIDSSGNVGIGTSSPNDKLHVAGNITVSDGSPEVTFQTSASHYNWQIAAQESTNGAFEIAVGSADADASNDSFSALMTVLQSGNVGIATTSPSERLHVNGHIVGNSLNIPSNTSSPPSGVTIHKPANDVMAFRTASTERMRINSDGHVLVGKTNEAASIVGFAATPITGYRATTTSGNFNICNTASATGTETLIQFRYSDTVKGSISCNGTTVAYNTSSDYRLKENVNYDFDATTRLKQLKPARFNFIADTDTTVDGFIAHEVSSVVPEAISGEKDTVDDDGNPKYQGIDQAKLVPLLVKTIQELEARITALETNQP